MDRRSIIKTAGLAGVLAAGVAPAVHAQQAVRWRLASSFPKSLSTIYGSAEKLSSEVKAMSGGKFEISVHPAGELMPAFGVVDALQGDNIEIGQTAAYYFTGKDPIFAFSTAVPFGLTTLQLNAWKDHGNGRKLLDAFFEKYNFRTASAGNTTTQMGGWYRKEIKTPEDRSFFYPASTTSRPFGKALKQVATTTSPNPSPPLSWPPNCAPCSAC